jgi:hypothetical protein
MSSSARSSFAAAGTNRHVNMNLNTAGGSKKQGLTSLVGLDNWADRAVKINSIGTPATRSTIFTMNQLGGIGNGRSMFNVASNAARPDGVTRIPPYVFRMRYNN